MGTPTGDMLRAASACAGMAVEASAEAAGLRKRNAELDAAVLGAVHLLRSGDVDDAIELLENTYHRTT
jgi:hypothetical protein